MCIIIVHGAFPQTGRHRHDVTGEIRSAVSGPALTVQMGGGTVVFRFFLDDAADDPEDAAENRWRRGARGAVQRVRRKSRVQKQHSYDDDIKPGAGQAGAQGVAASSTLTADGQGERQQG